MSQDSSTQRRFTDKEVGAILRRATELQEQEEGTPVEGTSLAQLQQAAVELGVKPHLIAKAAADIASGSEPHVPAFVWGGPRKIEVERIVGYPISEENWPLLLEEMRRVSGRVGEPRAVGKTWEWTSSSPTPLHVSVLPQGEHSRVRVSTHVGEWGIACYTLAGMVAFIASIGLTKTHPGWSMPVDVAVVGGLFTAAFGVARTAFQAIGNSYRRTTHALLSVLENPPEQALTATPALTPYPTQPDRELQPVQQVVGIVDQP